MSSATSESFVTSIPADLPSGHHDEAWLRRDNSGLHPSREVTPLTQQFLNSMCDELASHPEFDDYSWGTTFLNVINNPGPSGGGVFHYDTGFDRPVHNCNVGQPVVRAAAAWSSDDYPVSYAFSTNPAHFNRWVREVLGEDGITQPPNGQVVLYDEGTGIHGLMPRNESRPGAVTIVFSAVLYLPFQVPTLIPSLAKLQRPEFYTWRGCYEGTGGVLLSRMPQEE